MSSVGFIIHPVYRIRDGKAFVYLYGRLESGESFVTVNEFQPYFFIRKSDLEKALSLGKFINEETGLKNFHEEDVVKIVLTVPSEVKPLREKLVKAGVTCYEADIRFEYRFMIDHGLQGGVEVIGKGRKGEFTDLIFNEPAFKPADYFPKNLKVLSLDIETDMRAKKIFAISIASGDFRRVLIISDKKLKDAESFKKEEEMLTRFKEIIKELDPDIITGWNLIGFDLKIIEEKFKQHKIPFTLGRSDENSALRITDSFFRESKAEILGRMVLDGIQVLKNNFISLDDYKLETAAQHFLGQSKLIDEEDKGKKIEDAFKHDPQLLVDYNLKDSVLVLDILEKSTALNLTIQRSLLAGMPLDRVKASIASLDSVYLKEARKRGYVAPTSGFEEDAGEGKGGYVMQSKPGIYDYIAVCDFKSLYPSIMRTFNIDPLSFVPDCKGKNLVKLPSGACFKNQEGIMPDIIARLLAQREKAAKAKNEYARYAIKILMNSFYGVMANPTCRFYSREMANGITLTGQHIIKMAAKKVEEMGYEVIYGDTDSIFIHLKIDNEKEAHKIGDKIAENINSFFKKHIEEEYDRRSWLDIQFEKVYKRFIMPKVRGSDVGSKKRYAGLLVDKDGNEKLEFVGLEFVRRDWTALAKEFQKEILDRIFHKKEVTDYIRTMVQEVREGKHDDLLIYRKSIRKEVADYTKTTPQHVKAARLLGKDITSSLIEYYVTVEGPEPIQKLKHKIDYEHYIDKQMRPIADSVLDFFGTTFDDTINNSKQKTLFGY
jgi:DNA polymerase II